MMREKGKPTNGSRNKGCKTAFVPPEAENITGTRHVCD
ncbi:MAG: hypothetical protein AVDCRST_MAG56-8181 [uncultured Cytophagales bacterium]|uniref:Uncharacterized protein n=1 Tax=uncultured Cytophagales bacterium TaxID=158755 RepID=A0A6J4LZG6_9SPHI|nr:MAG: hypothetical protein AVDCRST_MAG56-8181 [uncultured Cytophagales bacterium]